MNPSTIIIGGGLAGLSLAQALVQSGHQPQQITLVHQAIEGTTGSTNPGGLLNPVPGASLNPKPGTLTAFQYTMDWIQTFPETLQAQCITDLKLLRPYSLQIQPGRRLFKSFQQHQETIAEHVGVRHLSLDELNEQYPHLTHCDGAIEFSQAATLPMDKLCDYLRAELGGSGVNIIHDWVHNISQGHQHWTVKLNDQTIDSERVVLAAGSHLPHFFPKLPLRSTSGHLLKVKMPDHYPTTHAISGRGHLCPMADGAWILGATYHQEGAPEPVTDEEVHTLLLEKIGRWVPAAQDSTWIQSWRGVRAVVSNEKQPLIGSVPNYSGLFILGGFASRGLQWAPFCAQQLARHLLGEDLKLPETIMTSRLSTEQWLLKEC